jgi:uncharacterized OB-fold protein
VTNSGPDSRNAGRPLPEPDEQSAAYWLAAAEHVLTVARCSVCHEATMPPDPVCPHCFSVEPAFQFTPVSGRGQVCSWTVMRQAFVPGFEPPFVLVDVQLDDAPSVRMIGRLLDGVAAEIHIGDVVDVAFEDVASGVSVPAFTLVAR